MRGGTAVSLGVMGRALGCVKMRSGGGGLEVRVGVGWTDTPWHHRRYASGDHRRNAARRLVGLQGLVMVRMGVASSSVVTRAVVDRVGKPCIRPVLHPPLHWPPIHHLFRWQHRNGIAANIIWPRVRVLRIRCHFMDDGVDGLRAHLTLGIAVMHPRRYRSVQRGIRSSQVVIGRACWSSVLWDMAILLWDMAILGDLAILGDVAILWDVAILRYMAILGWHMAIWW
jgi:hypothetical protein